MSSTLAPMERPLSEAEVEAYHRDGYIFLEDALSADQLSALREDFAAWREESRQHSEAYGVTMDDRPRFDVEPGHSADAPALRRIASPTEISDAYLDAMRNAPGVDAVAQVVGPNVQFNNAKINSKQPGAATQVKFHQDFAFQPHSNTDLVAVLYFLDDVTLDNGPLRVVPGSHKGELYSHWEDDVFSGVVAPDVVEMAEREAVPCIGPAGSACLMHNLLLHGSSPNVSDQPRTLFIAEYRSDDAIPLATSHIPSRHEAELVRGEASDSVRTPEFTMRIPPVPKTASFFNQQAKIDLVDAPAADIDIDLRYSDSDVS